MKPDLFNYVDPLQPAAGPVADAILQQLDGAEWDALLGFTETQRFADGECILRAGESDRTLYIVRAGHIRGEVLVGARARPLAPMGPGSVFGELAFFDGAPRSATLWAQGAVELSLLGRPAFDRLAAWYPRIARELLLDLGRVLSTRLRRAEAAR